MATLMLEGGAAIRFIQAMLEHASLNTTQIYTHVAVKQLQIIHGKPYHHKVWQHCISAKRNWRGIFTRYWNRSDWAARSWWSRITGL